MKKEQYMSIGMCMGLSIGVALGSVFDNIPVWMCLGLSVGLSVGLLIDRMREKKSGDEDQDPQ